MEVANSQLVTSIYRAGDKNLAGAGAPGAGAPLARAPTRARLGRARGLSLGLGRAGRACNGGSIRCFTQ